MVGIYRAPNENLWVIESLVAGTGFLGNCMKRSIIGGYFNLTHVDWKGIEESISVTEAFINRLLLDNGYTQVVGKPTRWDSLLDVQLVHSYLAVRCTRDQ